MRRFDVIVRVIPRDGRWEEWAVQVDARDEAAALSKVFRRRMWAEMALTPNTTKRISAVEVTP